MSKQSYTTSVAQSANNFILDHSGEMMSLDVLKRSLREVSGEWKKVWEYLKQFDLLEVQNGIARVKNRDANG